MNECINGHCLTCSDDMLQVRVLQVDKDAGLALVEVRGQKEEVDITLLEQVTPGNILLVHGGIALAHGNEDGQYEH